MKNYTNVLHKYNCESSNFLISKASDNKKVSKKSTKLTVIHNVNSLYTSRIQLNKKETRPAFSAEHANSIFSEKSLPLKEAAIATKPLKHFDAVVSDTVGFTIFCLLLIATGTLVWVSFS